MFELAKNSFRNLKKQWNEVQKIEVAIQGDTNRRTNRHLKRRQRVSLISMYPPRYSLVLPLEVAKTHQDTLHICRQARPRPWLSSRSPPWTISFRRGLQARGRLNWGQGGVEGSLGIGSRATPRSKGPAKDENSRNIDACLAVGIGVSQSDTFFFI
jgi:hypothetical protein